MRAFLVLFTLSFLVSLFAYTWDPSLGLESTVTTFVTVNNSGSGMNLNVSNNINTSSPSVSAGVLFDAVPFLGVVWPTIRGLFDFIAAPWELMTKLQTPSDIRLLIGATLSTLYVLTFVTAIFRI